MSEETVATSALPGPMPRTKPEAQRGTPSEYGKRQQSTKRRQILLVEDEDAIRCNYSELLQDAGFDVAGFANASDAIACASALLPDAAVLDLRLENDAEAGFVLLGALRSLSPTLPIVFLTQDDREESQVVGYKLGVDDYIIKELHSLDFLVVRLNALLRRVSVLSKGVPDNNVVRVGQLTLNKELAKVAWNGAEVELTLTRAWLVEELVREPGVVRSPDELMSAASIRVTANAIAKHVSAIRKAFENVDPHFEKIQTERARGYRWLP